MRESYTGEGGGEREGEKLSIKVDDIRRKADIRNTIEKFYVNQESLTTSVAGKMPQCITGRRG